MLVREEGEGEDSVGEGGGKVEEEATPSVWRGNDGRKGG